MEPRLDLSVIAPMSISALDAVAASAVQNAQALEVRIEGLAKVIDDTVATEREARAKQLESVPLEQRNLTKRIEELVYNNRRRELRKEVLEKNEAEVEKRMSELAEQKQKLETVRDLLGPDPAHYVTTISLTSEKIGPYIDQVRNFQSGALAQAGRVAVASKNVELGAAVRR